MQSFWTPNTLINWHGISAYPTCVTVVKRASEVHWIRINVLEEFFCIILFDTFWMEEFSTICGWAFGEFILSLIFTSSFINKFLSVFAFAFFTFFIFSAKVITFSFTDETLNNVRFTVLATERQISDFFQLIAFHTKFFNFIFGGYIIKVLITLIFAFLLAFSMEGPFAVAFAKDAALGFFTKMTKFFKVLLFFSISDFVFIRAFLLIFFLLLFTKNVVVFLWACIDFFLLYWSYHTFFGDLKLLNVKLFEPSWGFAYFFQPLTGQVSVMLVELTLWVDDCKELTEVNLIVSIEAGQR